MNDGCCVYCGGRVDSLSQYHNRCLDDHWKRRQESLDGYLQAPTEREMMQARII